MQIYSLTNIGWMLAHNYRPEELSSRMRIVYYLSKNSGTKDKQSILSSTNASPYDLSYLVSKNILRTTDGVQV